MTKGPIPAITGNPVIDSFLRASILAASAAAVAWLASKLKITDPNYLLMIGCIVVAVLTGAATFVWSYVQIQLARSHIAKQVFDAAVSGAVPAAIAVHLPAEEKRALGVRIGAAVAVKSGSSDKGTAAA